MNNRANLIHQRLERLRVTNETELAMTGLKISTLNTTELLEELQVHQIELEIQNEELRQASIALTESHDRYVDLYEFAPVGYLSLTVEGLITEVNFTATVLLGVARAKLINRRFARYIYSEDNDCWHQHFIQLTTQHERKQNCEIRFSRPDGTLFYALLDMIYIDTGNMPSLRVTLTDITVLKKTELALSEARNEADKANASKSEFLANINHKIRTPLNSIIGISYLFQGTKLTPKQQEYLTKINYAANTLCNAVELISDFSKIESNALILKTEPFALDELLSNIHGLFDIAMIEKRIKFIFSIANDIPQYLIGDFTRLTQILTDLISNAIKFTESGEITITIRPEIVTSKSTCLFFSVRDTGAGINHFQLSQLSKFFDQIGGSITREYDVNGLGLAMSKRLIELMGGHLCVESVLNKGSLFTFTINLGIADDVIESELFDETTTNLVGRRVLLVDDDELSRTITVELLMTLGILVETASNGEEGVERVKAEPFDLVLMDIQMPTMDGLTATQKIRTESRFADLTIIAMTASASCDAEEKSLACGVNGYLTKPIYPKKLVEILNLWLPPVDTNHNK